MATLNHDNAARVAQRALKDAGFFIVTRYSPIAARQSNPGRNVQVRSSAGGGVSVTLWKSNPGAMEEIRAAMTAAGFFIVPHMTTDDGFLFDIAMTHVTDPRDPSLVDAHCPNCNRVTPQKPQPGETPESTLNPMFTCQRCGRAMRHTPMGVVDASPYATTAPADDANNIIDVDDDETIECVMCGMEAIEGRDVCADCMEKNTTTYEFTITDPTSETAEPTVSHCDRYAAARLLREWADRIESGGGVESFDANIMVDRGTPIAYKLTFHK